jgi:hypothetical protein
VGLLALLAPASAAQNVTAAGALAVVSDDQCRFNYRLRRWVVGCWCRTILLSQDSIVAQLWGGWLWRLVVSPMARLGAIPTGPVQPGDDQSTSPRPPTTILIPKFTRAR